MLSGRRLGLVLFGLSCMATIGCEPGFVFPTLFDSRSEAQKLADARKFDPYPDTNVGGGDMRGTRPLDFTNPRSDPDASKLQTRGPWPNTSSPPATYPAPPAIYAPPPTSYSPPGAIVYPPATTAPPGVVPPGTVPAATPAMYPPTGAAYPAAGASYPTATAAYSAPATTSYAGSVTMPNSGGTTAAPAAYGKALASP
jgi:hypothetical protein